MGLIGKLAHYGDVGLSYVPGYTPAKKLIQGDPSGAVKSLAMGPLGEAAYNAATGNTAAIPGYDDVNSATGGLLDGLKDALSPGTLDTSGLKQAQDRAFGLQDSLGAERAGYQGAFNPAKAGLLDTEAQKGIHYLDAAARGDVPSAAELQLRNQASTNAARGFGVAAALQGRSPGMALRQAMQNQAGVQAQTNADAAALRANEMAAARGQLVGAVQGQQGVQGNLRGQDISEKGNLLQGQVGAGNTGTTAAANVADANAKVIGAKYQMLGALGGGVAGALPKLSDERAKTDVHHADLDALAKALEGFTFKYRDPSEPGASPGPQVGPMVQDVEKGGPAGRAMVRELPSGRKGLDMGNMIGAALAMSAEALKRSRKAA